MPKLLTFGVCRQAIINRDDGAISLINLISSVTILRPDDQIIPSDANMPFDWGGAAVWLRLDEDAGKAFEQNNQLVSPDGNITDLGVSVFRLDARLVSNVLKAQGFPIGQAGTVTLKVNLREVGKEQEWKTFAEYPIEVIHQTTEEAAQEEEPIVTE